MVIKRCGTEIVVRLQVVRRRFHGAHINGKYSERAFQTFSEAHHFRLWWETGTEAGNTHRICRCSFPGTLRNSLFEWQTGKIERVTVGPGGTMMFFYLIYGCSVSTFKLVHDGVESLLITEAFSASQTIEASTIHGECEWGFSMRPLDCCCWWIVWHRPPKI